MEIWRAGEALTVCAVPSECVLLMWGGHFKDHSLRLTGRKTGKSPPPPQVVRLRGMAKLSFGPCVDVDSEWKKKSKIPTPFTAQRLLPYQDWLTQPPWCLQPNVCMYVSCLSVYNFSREPSLPDLSFSGPVYLLPFPLSLPLHSGMSLTVLGMVVGEYIIWTGTETVKTQAFY